MERGPTKPEWINEVKEVTREEARLLLDLGAEVGCDWSGILDPDEERFLWEDEPRWPHSDYTTRMLGADDGRYVVFYVRKDGEDEARNS